MDQFRHTLTVAARAAPGEAQARRIRESSDAESAGQLVYTLPRPDMSLDLPPLDASLPVRYHVTERSHDF